MRSGKGEPKTIGRFSVFESLWEDSAGTAYRALDSEDGTTVIVKRFHEPSEPGMTRAFERLCEELRASGALEHPGFLQLRDMGSEDDHLYFVTDYFEGRRLDEELRATGGMSGERAVALALDLAEALDFAHGKGFFHGEVKPGRVLVTKERAILTDFGVALLFGKASKHEGARIGTPAYMSPEYLFGEALSPASDQYSLAAVVFEALTGAPPFSKGEDLMKLAGALLEGRRTPVGELLPGAPLALDVVFERAFARKGADRYPSAVAFVRALERALESLPSRARAGGPRSLLDPPTSPPAPSPLPELSSAEEAERLVGEALMEAARGRRRRAGLLLLGGALSLAGVGLLFISMGLPVRDGARMTTVRSAARPPGKVERGDDSALAIATVLVDRRADEADIFEALELGAEKNPPGFLDVTLPLVTHDSFPIRLKVVTLLERWSKEERVVRALTEALGDRDPFVREAAARALGASEKPQALIVLVPAYLRERSRNVKGAMREAIRRLGGEG